MEQIQVVDQTVEFTDEGSGEPIVLVHAGVFSEWFEPLSRSKTLDGFRVIRVHRPGYIAGIRPDRHLTIADHARVCSELLTTLGTGPVHFCGHSSSCLIGLQLALDSPSTVKSLILLEPAPGGELAGGMDMAVFGEILAGALASYTCGDTAAGFAAFMRGVGGDRFREVIVNRLGVDGYARAEAESAFFPDEVSAVREWQFGPNEARQISQPALIIDGSESAKVAAIRPQSVPLLAAMLPNAEMRTIADATHLLPLEQPDDIGTLIADFVERQLRQTA